MHNCLSARGVASGCRDCRLKVLGYCENFLKLLAIKEKMLMREKALTSSDREDIFSDFVERVVTSVDSFRNQEASFTTWANRVFSNTRSDFFRKSRSLKNAKVNGGVYIYQSNTDKTKERAGIFIPDRIDGERVHEAKMSLMVLAKIMAESDPQKCVEFVINHYDWKGQGLSQREMAKRCGMSHEGFRKKLSRCRSQLRKKMEAR